MKKHLFYILIACMILFSSCLKNDIDNSIEQQIKNNVEQVFGTQFDKNHDWCTTVNKNITVYPNAQESIVKVQILLSEEGDSTYVFKLLNEANISNNSSLNISFDVPMNYSNLFVAFINEKGHYFYKRFNLEDTDVYYDGSNRTREIIGWKPSYPIPSITPVINGTVVTYAGSREWLPGEVFYTFDYETTNNESYDDEFKTLFRTVIFNYFPNGRAYDNLPKIKKSGYYNESVYPITTGDEPIVISPVYKNDGGYYEICYSELYYYYFKGNPTVEEIEALPKYRAIDLSTVYKNSDNDKIEKMPSYVLAYFGDGTPENGTVGSYQFPQGYRIGFVYKSNTHTDKKNNKEVENGNVKQGELYGDGRLNYNINSWGNFKTSKLGPTDPRMAWMSVNKKMFLCVESGTDRDYNDLILEVEGGIEPIEIDPDDPEYNFYTFCFEDHNLGDYDMNDVVIKGRRVNETTVEWTLMACGAHDDLYIYNVDGETINSEYEVHDIFGAPHKSFVNTEKNGAVYEYVVNTVRVPKSYSFLDASTQPYIYDETINNTVKIAIVGQDPHAIMIPYDFKWPIEKMCIRYAYTLFNNWGANKVTNTDWYKYPELEFVY